MTQCAEIMTSDIRFHAPNATVGTVSEACNKEPRVGPIPIVDGVDTMKLVGVVTERDLTVRVLAFDKEGKQTPIREVMTPKPVACRGDDPIENALRLMDESNSIGLPVVDKQNKLIGVIGKADVLARLSSKQHIKRVLAEQVIEG